MAEPSIFDLFVSYADADSAWVEGYLLDALTDAGVRYTTEAAFDLGAPRLAEFEEAVRQSTRTLLVLSPAYLADGFSRFGDLLVQTYGMETATWPVIPLVLYPVELPPRLAFLTALDATNREDWPAVTARLCAALRRPVPGLAVVDRPTCPYPGMVPFAEEDRGRFFGRDEEIRGAVECLRAHPFLTIIGPSGSGKSSLVFAGLVPAVRRSALFGRGEWLVRSLRPGATPLAALEMAISGDLSDVPKAVAKLLATESAARRLLIIVDQFEEVFTVGHEDRPQFEEAIRALAASPDCFVLLTTRADFYPELMGSTLWHDIQGQRLEVLPLGETGLRQAIVRPAEEIGVYVESALVERLVADAAGEPGALPLVQETLVLLWERLERRFLPLSAYEALVLPRSAYGTPATGRTGLQVAMARHADGALAQLSDVQQAVARRIFLRLVQFGEGRADTRRQQSVMALKATTDDLVLFEETLDHLAHHRLLTLAGEERGARTVDIAHEALISGWPRFAQWIAERREAEQARRRLEAKAEEWVRLGRGSAGLLDAAELAEADRWLQSPDAADLGHGDALPALVDASRAAADEARRREEAAHARELEQARALAAAQEQRARDQAQAAARLRARVLVAAFFGVIATAAIIAALLGREQAAAARERASLHERMARTIGLANEATRQLALRQDERAALLALEAHRINGGGAGAARGEVDEALRAVLAAPNFARILDTKTAVGRAGVDAVAFSPSDRLVIAGGRDGSLWRWDLNHPGEHPVVWRAHDEWVESVAFSPDGHLLASSGRDRTVKLWNIASPQVEQVESRAMEWRPTAVAFGPVGRRLAIGGDAGEVLLWDIGGPSVLLPSGADGVDSVAFSDDGQWLAAGGYGTGALQVWDLERLDAPPADLSEPGVTFGAVAFSPRSRMLAAGGSDGAVRTWTLGVFGNPALATNTSDTSSIAAVAFSPDGTTLAAANGPGRAAWLWNIERREIVAVLRGHESIVTSLAFNASGKTLATGGGDGVVRIWDVGPPTSPMVLPANAGGAFALAFSPVGSMLAVGSRDGPITLWDTSDPTSAPVSLVGHDDIVNGVAFSPDGQLLASGSRDRSVRLWSVDGPEEEETLPVEYGITSVTISPNGRWLAAGGGDSVTGVVWVWELGSATGPTRLRSSTGTIMAVAFNADGTLLAAGGCARLGRSPGTCDQGGVQLWETASLSVQAKQLVLDENANTEMVTSLAFDASGEHLAAGSLDGGVRLWSLDTLEKGSTPLPGAWSSVSTVAFNPGQRTIAAGDGTGIVSIWDLASGDLPVVVASHAGNVESVAFSPDGRLLASVGGDTLVRLSLTHQDDLVKAACQKVGRNLGRDEWRQFVGEHDSYQATCPGLPEGPDA